MNPGLAPGVSHIGPVSLTPGASPGLTIPAPFLILRHTSESPYHPTITLRSKEPPMTRSPIARVASVVVLCLLPPPSSRLPVVVEYPLPRAKAFPHDPAVGADGIVWYTDQANSYIGR